jgi:uncharacterized membrane protein YbhN (UPF0104 family)
MWIAFILILVHYIGDFMFQTENQALGKSTNFKQLISHTLTYTLVFYIAFALWCAYQNHFGHITPEVLGWTAKVFLFFPITFVCHTIIDFFTSKIASKKFKNKEYYTGLPNFGAFSIIGLDQVIHYATLFATYYFVTN